MAEQSFLRPGRAVWRRALAGGLAALLAGLALSPAMAATSRRTPVVEAVEKALPSIVSIGTEQLVKVRYNDPLRRFRGDLFDRFFSEFMRSGPAPAGVRVAHALGSGVIIDPQGYILTNCHVVERASRIRVVLSDETTYDAIVLAADEISDLALIKIDAAAPLQAVEFAEDDDLLLGETVIALGNPFGLAHTVTVGVLSAKNREATYQGQVLFRDILQTDAAVNLGSSGGPLVNLDGRLIGINVSFNPEAQNIGFAIPVKRARALLAQWLSPRLIRKLSLGFDVAESAEGLVVREVEEGGPASKADLFPGDLVRQVEKSPVRTRYDFNKALLGRGAGDRVEIGVERAGEARRAEITLAALPKPDGALLAEKRLGLAFGSAAEAAGGAAHYRKGLPIEKVFRGRGAARLGFRPGIWVTRINDMEIQTLDDVGLALENVNAGDTVTVAVASIEVRDALTIAQSSVVQMEAE
ncbi:MAG: trypsin-like peptidase domain-containing protein [Kiritimatiellae bacterium]|nr:trypsin-like peptidase domain-containing protein [Kiritimatiellia bacterium]